MGKHSLGADHWSKTKNYGTITKYLQQKTKQTKPKRKKVKKEPVSFIAMELPQESKLEILNLLIIFFHIKMERKSRLLQITKYSFISSTLTKIVL